MPGDATGNAGSLVAVDWGTSAFRAWLLDREGRILERVRGTDGALALSRRAERQRVRASVVFEKALVAACGRWLRRRAGMPVLCAGMMGAAQGWQEVGYLDVPSPLSAVARGLVHVRSSIGTVHFVPGLRSVGPEPDFMRGEEVQLIGTLASMSDPAATVVLPGTHSKWVDLDGDHVTGFVTAMTGELYGLLMGDSILARLATPTSSSDVTDAFVRGLEAEAAYGDQRGLLSLLFTARARVLAGRLAAPDVGDYLSGLLIGHETRHALRTASLGTVAVCGSPTTAHRYRFALERGGVDVRTVHEDAAALGLWHVAVGAALVPDPGAGGAPAGEELRHDHP